MLNYSLAHSTQINHCAFCVDINSDTLLKRGVPLEKVEALVDWRTSSLFADDERLALEYAEAMTMTERGVGDELRERVKSAADSVSNALQQAMG